MVAGTLLVALLGRTGEICNAVPVVGAAVAMAVAVVAATAVGGAVAVA